MAQFFINKRVVLLGPGSYDLELIATPVFPCTTRLEPLVRRCHVDVTMREALLELQVVARDFSTDLAADGHLVIHMGGD